MPRLSKYDSLKRWLQACDRTSVTLTFAELSEILGFDLPESALKYDSWWANSATGGSQIRAWRDAGWEVAEVDRSGRRVTFRRVSGAPVRSVRRNKGGIPIVTTAKSLDAANGQPQPPATSDKIDAAGAGEVLRQAPEAAENPERTVSPSAQTRETGEPAAPEEVAGIALPSDLVDVKRLPPQARRLLEVRARRNGRTLAKELAAIIAAAVGTEKRLLLDELRRLRESTERPGSYDLMALLGRRS